MLIGYVIVKEAKLQTFLVDGAFFVDGWLVIFAFLVDACIW